MVESGSERSESGPMNPDPISVACSGHSTVLGFTYKHRNTYTRYGMYVYTYVYTHSTLMYEVYTYKKDTQLFEKLQIHQLQYQESSQCVCAHVLQVLCVCV